MYFDAESKDLIPDSVYDYVDSWFDYVTVDNKKETNKGGER